MRSGFLALVLLLSLLPLRVGWAQSRAIGVTTEIVPDRSRGVGTPMSPRNVQITIWYPAKAERRSPVAYGDYFDLAQAERGTSTDSSRLAARARYAAFLASTGVSDSAIARWFATPMRALRGAEPVGGRSPLVVIVHGNGQSAADQSLLAEFLAISGYVVATSPSYTRISKPPTSENDLGAGAEEQADDIAFVVATARKRTDVDSTRVGVVAHSLGARGALLYVMRAANAQALVSLDGGIGTATGRGAMEHSPSFGARRVHAPVLHFYETLDAFMAPDLTLLSQLSGAEIITARVTAMHHHHFTDLGAWGPRVPGLTNATGASEQTAASHRILLHVARAFLDSHVRGDATAFAKARAATARDTATLPAIEFSTMTPRR